MSRIDRSFVRAIFLLFVLGAVLRFFELDVRPVHHDESLHGTYSRYILRNPEGQFYKYNPMLHGPLLYTVTSWAFELFGPSTFVLRSVNATLGSLLILAPLLFRGLLSPGAIFALSLVSALSPTFTYWSRFAHHDYLVLSSYLLFALGLTRIRGGLILCCLSIALQYSTKANVFVFLAQLIGFLAFEFLISSLRRETSLAWRVAESIRRRAAELIIGILSAALTFAFLYSANFRYQKGILDGLYREVFPYWLNQHSIQRLDGPFGYHLFTLSLYELPLVLLFCGLVLFELKGASRRISIPAVAVFLLSLVAAALIPNNLYSGPLKAHLKLTGWFDLVLSFTVAGLAVLLPLHHRIRREHELSFFSYFALSTLWTYSFLGEKVPWLSLYPLVGIVLYSVVLLDRRELLTKLYTSEIEWTRFGRTLMSSGVILILISIIESVVRRDSEMLNRLQLSVFCWLIALGIFLLVLERRLGAARLRTWILATGIFAVLSLHSSIITNYTNAGADSELYSQVHTTPQMHKALLGMRELLENPLSGPETRALVSGASVWPATWYIGEMEGYSFQAEAADYPNFRAIIMDANSPNKPLEFMESEIPLQAWWVPDYSKMRLRDLFGYYFTHRPWNPTGALKVKLFTPQEPLGLDAGMSIDTEVSTEDNTSDEELSAEEELPEEELSQDENPTP